MIKGYLKTDKENVLFFHFNALKFGFFVCLCRTHKILCLKFICKTFDIMFTNSPMPTPWPVFLVCKQIHTGVPDSGFQMLVHICIYKYKYVKIQGNQTQFQHITNQWQYREINKLPVFFIFCYKPRLTSSSFCLFHYLRAICILTSHTAFDEYWIKTSRNQIVI